MFKQLWVDAACFIWPNKKTCILVIVIILVNLSFSYSEFILETNLRFLLVLAVF